MTFISHCLRLLLLLLFLIPLVTTSATAQPRVINTGWNLVTNANVAFFIARFAVGVLHVNGIGVFQIISVTSVMRYQVLSFEHSDIETLRTTYSVRVVGYFIGPAAIWHASQQVVKLVDLGILFSVLGSPLKLDNPSTVGRDHFKVLVLGHLY
ncbi:hypothetical protein AXF42_Ash014865 [Apostasia shenzhenica]|uniref:Uncharacterized protein n=1 Tax=Apostasia shenzhenica TaxID=1088818 RepID=A0A2I0ALB9_9ASPA|nr:hypothetical protein AXF42_Ash014865 [Apostasia shenzhenica]